jgi:hypothetical protein
MGLWGFKNRDDAVVAKRLVDERRHLPAYAEIGTPEELPDWAQDACLAVVTTQIPARSGRTAGGPVTATLQRLDTATKAIEDETGEGATVQVYSWADVVSSDPSEETDDELFIWIGQDRNGIWWFLNEAC